MYVLFLKQHQGCDRADQSSLAATELPFPRQKERGGEWPEPQNPFVALYLVPIYRPTLR